MARRVSDNFSAGMITDVIGAENSALTLHNLYNRRAGELCSRGPIQSVSAGTAISIPASNYYKGTTAAGFHPNFGTGAVVGWSSASATSSAATAHKLVAAPLQSASAATAATASLSWVNLLEGTNNNDVYVGYATASAVGGSAVYTASASAVNYPFEACNKPCNTGEEMVFPGQLGALYKWGGSVLGTYSTGTAQVAGATAATAASALASRIIKGTGTSWAANVQPGQYIRIGTIARNSYFESRYFRITEVFDNTTLEIETPLYITGTPTAGYVTGLTYRIQSVALVQSPMGVWNATDERPRQMGNCAYHGGRLWTAGVADYETDYSDVFNLDRVRWSGSKDEQGTFNMDTDPKSASAGQATSLKTRTTEAFYSHLDLWHPNAYIDVFPGIGGAIRGLVSMGNELVIIKSHGMFRITGSFNYDGTGEGISLQIISETVGADSPNAYALTKRGLVIASSDGLYLYDGQTVTSLTDGRVRTFWEDMFSNRVKSLAAFEDKVIVSVISTSAVSGLKSLVWDIDNDYFWTTNGISSPVEGLAVFADDDTFVEDYMFSNTPGTGPLEYRCMKRMTHKTGFNFFDDTLTAELITHPFPLGEDAVSEGRVNTVFVHALNTLESASYPSCTVTLLPGSTTPGVIASSAEFGGETIAAQEYGVVGGSQDRIHRIAIDASPIVPTCRLKLAYDFTSVDSTARLYSIGIEYEPADVRGPTA